MKSLLTKILALALSIATLFTLTACGDTHKHAFDQKSTDETYLASEATCTAPAKYYYSCSCGEKGDATFDLGSASHDYVDHVCSRCQAKEVYTEGLRISKTGYVLGFEEGATIPTDKVYVPTKINGIEVKAIGLGAFQNATFKQIVLPEGLERIENDAFRGSKLTSITIPASVNYIGSYAFSDSSLGTANFINPYGWYVSRHKVTAPIPGSMESVATLSNSTSAANMLTNDASQNAGTCMWFRFD